MSPRLVAPEACAMLLAAVAVALVGLLVACPRLPDPDGCTPRAFACRTGRPFVCSNDRRWTPADRPCAELRAVCCETPSVYGGRLLTACVRPEDCADAGAMGGDR